jgi:hypothetical protein
VTGRSQGSIKALRGSCSGPVGRWVSGSHSGIFIAWHSVVFVHSSGTSGQSLTLHDATGHCSIASALSSLALKPS